MQYLSSALIKEVSSDKTYGSGHCHRHYGPEAFIANDEDLVYTAADVIELLSVPSTSTHWHSRIDKLLD